MGQAIGEQLKADYLIFACDKDKSKLENLKGINIEKSCLNLVGKVDTVILAVKPQELEELLNKIKPEVKGKPIISIAAGISTGYIEKLLDNARVIRAMPNIGAKIGKSVTCICKGLFATEEDLGTAKEIFNNIGEVQELSEDMMNAATAISGSGPGYYFYAIELNFEEYKTNHKKFHEDFVNSLAKAAREVGFNEKTAQFLAHWTIVYSDLLLKETGLKPGELKKQVISKGGTTEAALEVLHRGGTLVDAVKAAVERAKALSRG